MYVRATFTGKIIRQTVSYPRCVRLPKRTSISTSISNPICSLSTLLYSEVHFPDALFKPLPICFLIYFHFIAQISTAFPSGRPRHNVSRAAPYRHHCPARASIMQLLAVTFAPFPPAPFFTIQVSVSIVKPTAILRSTLIQSS